jgi:hypothetical protein
VATARRRAVGVSLFSLIVGVGAALFAPPASAQGIGERGRVLVSAERLFGVSNSKIGVTTVSGGVERRTSADRSTLGLFIAAPTNVYQFPRLALDYVPTTGLTLGAALGFSMGTLDTSTAAGATTTLFEGPTTYGFLVQPRVGYALGLGTRFGLWLRGGATYFRQSSSSEGSVLGGTREVRIVQWGLSVNLEPQAVLLVTPSFGFTAGIVADLPLTGNREASTSMRTTGGTVTRTSSSEDLSVRSVGLLFGLLGAF